MSDLVLDRYQNAPRLPHTLARDWLRSAWRTWLDNRMLIMAMALLILALRWQLDFVDRGVIILLSYFTDAFLFAWCFAALQARQAGDHAASSIRSVWGIMKPRTKPILLCGLWGLPAALMSYLLFSLLPDFIKGLVVTLGIGWLGSIITLLVVLAGGYLTLLAGLLPNLAAIQMLRDAQAGFRSGGLWAFRGLRAGWRPLLVLFMAFISSAMVAGLLLTPVFGHLPVEYFSEGERGVFWLRYWYSWPGLFIAMNIFLALLPSLADSLLKAADEDLSDEVFDPQSHEATGKDFVITLLNGAGFALRSLAALSFLLLITYSFLTGLDQALSWLGTSVVLYLWGGTFRSSAWARQEGKGLMARYLFAWIFLLPAMIILGLAIFVL
jgi:hypothetical protein